MIRITLGLLLGLFVDKQMPYFMQYASSIINRAINTKGVHRLLKDSMLNLTQLN